MKLLFLFKSEDALRYERVQKLMQEMNDLKKKWLPIEAGIYVRPALVNVRTVGYEYSTGGINPYLAEAEFEWEWEYVNDNEREHTRPNAADVGPVGI